MSGFVIGNCRGGTPVAGLATDQCAAGCIRGAKSEGGGWQAVAPPRSAEFGACGWMNTKNRLTSSSGSGAGARADDGAGPAPGAASRSCAGRAGPDLALLQRYVKRFTGRSVAGAPLPTTEKYPGLYLWAGRFTNGPRRGQEGGGQRHVPHLAGAASAGCTAYANLEPWHGDQRVRAKEAMWTVHDGSRQLDIRYLSRFQGDDEQGRPQWWVNAHSRAPQDRDQPWGFLSAACLFSAQRAERGRPPAAAVSRKNRRFARLGARHRGTARCGFAPTGFHEILERRGLSCAQAKRVLRRLRGEHDLVPMACSGPRRVQGWRLTSVVRDPSLGITRYARGRQRITYQRHQFPDNPWCPMPR